MNHSKPRTGLREVLAIVELPDVNAQFMMKTVTIAIMAALSVVLLLGSCRATKTIQTAINKKDTTVVKVIDDPGVDSAAIIGQILEKLRNREIKFQTFSAKLKLDYTDLNGKSNTATAFIRLQKDSVLWISLTGTLGVEGFRALIKPDSVIVLDKLEKTVTRRSAAYLQEITQLPLDFNALQNLLVGNPVYFSGNIVSFKNEGNNITALCIGEYFKHLLSIDTVSNTIGYSKIDDVDVTRNRTCFIGYSNYTPAAGSTFSTMRDITVTEKNSLNVKLEYKQFTFDETLSFPFTIPKNYKEK